MPFRLTVPHKAFNRKIGTLSPASACRPTAASSAKRSGTRTRREWLPTAEDRAFVASLMGRVVEPGKFANWIAPPGDGHQQPAGRLRVRPLQLRRPPGARRAARCTTRACAPHGEPAAPWRTDSASSAAPDRSGDLHPLQHLRGDLPGRRDHARRRATTSSTSRSCNGCNACISPCPTGAIDNWRQVPKARAVHARRAAGLGQLPPREPSSSRSSVAADRPCRSASVRADSRAIAGRRRQAAAYGATVPPWSAAHPYVNLYSARRTRRSRRSPATIA